MIKSILSKLYGTVVSSRNNKFDENGAKITLNTPVIGVGNLNVGGTGKTPFVQMMTWLLLKNKINPAIVGLGYKRNSKGSVVVSDGKEIFVDAETGGDEMFLLADSLKVPVLAHSDKAEGARLAENKFAPDVIIVDDAYQHRQLYRDLDILMIDADTINEPFLMPKGRLREPLSGAERADIICYIGNVVPSDEFLSYLKPETLQIRVSRKQGKPFDLTNGKYILKRDNQALKNGVIAFSGIGKPAGFDAMLQSDRIKIIDTIHFDDHHKYVEKDIEKLISSCKKNECKYLATTEKDAAKLKKHADKFEAANVICVVFPIRLKIEEGFQDFKKLLNSVLKIKK